MTVACAEEAPGGGPCGATWPLYAHRCKAGSPSPTTTTWIVRAMGCDDATDVELELTDWEVQTVMRLCVALTERGGGCQPTLGCRPKDSAPTDWFP